MSKSFGIISSSQKGAKIYYNILTQEDKQPNCCSKWETLFKDTIDWKKCFGKIKEIQEIKLRWFQMRIVHRILAANIILKEIGVVASNICTQCNNEKDSILHAFWECNISKVFGNDFLEFLHTNCVHAHNLWLNEKIILGIDNNLKNDKIFDYILLCAKFYLYQYKINKTKPKFAVFRRKKIETTVGSRII